MLRLLYQHIYKTNYFKQILTKDSVTIAVDAVVYYRVQDATMSIANVANADGATRFYNFQYILY